MLTALATPNFDSYRTQFSARLPDLTRKQYDDEEADVSSHNDVYSLPHAPAGNHLRGTPPTEPRSAGEKMHIWLVLPEDVVFSEEAGHSGASTQRKRLSHTNLSGGNPAHCGGELWFRDEGSIWITGGSSRYAPRSDEELHSLAQSFVDSGYSVCSCGWDSDNAMPARFFRGNEKWLSENGH